MANDIFINVSCETNYAPRTYFKLIKRWKKVNLMSSNICYNSFFYEHYRDGLLISNVISDKNSVIIDVGSGAGIPGAVLAIHGYKNVLLIDISKKKTAFLLKLNAELKTSFFIVNDDIRNINMKADYVISRGVDTMYNIVQLTNKLLHTELKFIFFKTKKLFKEEIEELKNRYFLECQVYKDLKSDKFDDRVIIQLKIKGDKYDL